MQQACKIIKSKDVYIDGNVLVIEIKPIELLNDEMFEIIICQNIPIQANEMNKVKVLNNNLINLHNVTGNYTRADQIKTRTRYLMVYGTDPSHISLLRRIRSSKFNYNNLTKKEN